MSTRSTTAWWTAPPDRHDPLELLERDALPALRAGQPVPMAAARLIESGLRHIMAGRTFEAGLDLARHHHRRPAAHHAQAWRNDALRRLAALLPPASRRKLASKIADLLHRPGAQPDRGLYLTEADLLLDELRLRARHGLDLPTSERQIARILANQY